MSILFEYRVNDAFLVATISDTSISAQRAKTILKLIETECHKYKCQKALVNELALEKREIANHQLHTIAESMPDIHLAFLCRPELKDDKAKLFAAITFNEGYLLKHFSVEKEAIDWLKTIKRPSTADL